MSDLVYRMVPVFEAKAEADGTTVVIASTDTVDSYEDVVDQGSWRLKRHKSNPVVLWAHNSHQPPVGRAAMSVEEGKLMARITWDEGDDNPTGRLVGRQFRDGFLNAVSVGFMPHKRTLRRELPKDHPSYGERGYLLQENELYELSAVSIPANPDATVPRHVARSAPLDRAGKEALLRDLLADPALRSMASGLLAPAAPLDPIAELFGLGRT